MLDTHAETVPDRRPAIVICAYDVSETGWDPVEDPSGLPWGPVGGRTIPVAATDPRTLATTLTARLMEPGCRALLLVGRTRHGDAFRIQMRAENRALDGTARLDPTGPCSARATAPVAEIVEAMNEAGLTAHASSDYEDDVGNYLLYRILSDLPDGADSPAVSLIRAPATVSDAELRRGVQTAAATMARHLSPLPRSAQT